MSPVRYVDNNILFEERQDQLNRVLSFSGYLLGEDGMLTKIKKASTIGEAQKRAKKLKRDLINRNVHGDVLIFCKAELLQDNCLHAVFEATKSVAEKMRTKTGLIEDGSKLVDLAFYGSKPLLAINSLRTQTEKSEQNGFASLLKGFFGIFRNTTAHAPKVSWIIKEEDALDMLTLASFLQRKLVKSITTSFSSK